MHVAGNRTRQDALCKQCIEALERRLQGPPVQISHPLVRRPRRFVGNVLLPDGVAAVVGAHRRDSPLIQTAHSAKAKCCLYTRWH